ncbi:oxidoreductase-like protein [Dendryphion nanum]|uniref:Oxidoreductase-like protein n=1 Tax=Dendryphion nanum TaxID=256645 RepID=A0A9P9IY82_9PLEO|nr:oxidoreductase-like protein [Dendryphion nanum]
MASPIPFGIIGTNWITHSYVECAQATNHFVLRAVFSRKAETAQEFASKYPKNGDIAIHTSLSAIASDPTITTVYIASPNSLHYDQTKQMLEAGKHVILEKPATCTSAQLDALFQLAYSRQLILIEAYRHVHEKNFKLIKNEGLKKIGKVLGGTINYIQFSSRYDALLRGERPNIFNLDFGAGCLCDLGVYNVSFAVELFGEPESATYAPIILPQTGADGGGTLVLKYSDFALTLTASKVYTSTTPSEIYGENGTLVFPTITDIDSVKLLDPRKKEDQGVELTTERAEKLNLIEEAREHARIINETDWEAVKRWEGLSRGVVKVTEGVRKANGLKFPGDQW